MVHVRIVTKRNVSMRRISMRGIRMVLHEVLQAVLGRVVMEQLRGLYEINFVNQHWFLLFWSNLLHEIHLRRLKRHRQQGWTALLVNSAEG